MRIGINGRFYAARLAGVQRVASELAKEVYARAETVLFLPVDAAEPAHVPARVVRGRQRGHLFEQVELKKLARAHSCAVLLHPANTAPVQGGPDIVIVHDVLPLTNPEWFTRKYVWWQRHVVRRALRNAAHLLTSTAWSADQIARVCALPPARISLLPQGLAPFLAPASPANVLSMRARLNLQQPYFLAIGWGDPRKNLRFLLPVIEALRAKRDVRLVIVGAHNRRVHRAPDFLLPAWAQRVARVDDEQLRALYTGATALCFPSLAEGYGRPPLEALACGTPAVVSDYDPAREVFGAGVDLLPLEQESWTRTLAALLESAEERQQQVSRAQGLLSRMSWSAAAEVVLQVATRITARPVAV